MTEIKRLYQVYKALREGKTNVECPACGQPNDGAYVCVACWGPFYEYMGRYKIKFMGTKSFKEFKHKCLMGKLGG